ncbi:MAG TPA: hypothetical protein VLM80_02180, partial [Anaerolineales bacterium]|nr:hypothetical protein [Anaerolineales bacterium]
GIILMGLCFWLSACSTPTQSTFIVPSTSIEIVTTITPTSQLLPTILVPMPTQTIPPLDPMADLHSRWMAYITAQDGDTHLNSEIYRMRMDGSDRQLLLSEPYVFIGLTASPDGSQLAFYGCPGSISSDCSGGTDFDIFLLPFDGGEFKALTGPEGEDYYPDWSPDGRIAFTSFRENLGQVYILDLQSGEEIQVTKDGSYNTEPKWSSDGQWIAFHYRDELNTHIRVISPEGEFAGLPLEGTMPVWSPGSRSEPLLAFLCFSGSYSDVCVASPDGSSVRNLTNSPWDESSPTWSPDGKWLAFSTNRGNDVDIYKIFVDCPEGTEPVRVTDGTRAVSSPLWTPEGDWLVFHEGQDLMVIKADLSYTSFLASPVFGKPVFLTK